MCLVGFEILLFAFRMKPVNEGLNSVCVGCEMLLVQFWFEYWVHVYDLYQNELFLVAQLVSVMN